MSSPATMKRPKRWDRPFDEGMDDSSLNKLLNISPFAQVDQRSYPDFCDMLLNDSRIVQFTDGDIIVREGDYGNSVFWVLSGKVRVVLQSLPAAVLGRVQPKRRGIFSAISQLFYKNKIPELRDADSYQKYLQTKGVASTKVAARKVADKTQLYLRDTKAISQNYQTKLLVEGAMFGEIAAMSRTARTVTVYAQGNVQLLEMRWQGFRDLCRHDQSIREHTEKLYRERSLAVALRATPLFSHLDDESLQAIANASEFESYGDFDWFVRYKKIVDQDTDRRIADEPIIAEQGHYPNGLILLRSGFARLSVSYGHGQQTLNYLGKSDHYGLAELAYRWQTNKDMPLQKTLRAVGHVDILRIPTIVIEDYVFKHMNDSKLIELSQSITKHKQHKLQPKINTGMLEFIVQERFMNGTATMIIDTNRCTRCDNCVTACADAHDSNPKFVRHGKHYDHYMVANACMHCVDPVCLIGCPTGAIARDALSGQVIINDNTCIGCQTCANSCPYDNIRMVEIRSKDSNYFLDEQNQQPILKATKCDLCIDQLGGPACQRACPHDALIRADMRDQDTLAKWLNR